MEESIILEKKTRTTKQTQSQGLLHTAFEEALERAAALDLKGSGHDDPDGLFDGLPATNVERVMEAFEHYRQNREVMDVAVLGAANYLQTPHGAAQVKALQASFTSTTPNPLSDQLAMEIQSSPEFDVVRATSGNSSLQSIGIGISGGAAFVIGALAGAEVLIDWERNDVINGRAWYGLSIETGITLNLGLELSFWNQTPLSGAIKGWFIDLWVPISTIPVPLGLRYMFIKQREAGSTKFSYAASTIQLPLEFVIPIGAFGLRFWARQYSWSRRRLASLSVVDGTTGLSQITVDTATTLKVTLENTSGDSLALNSGATMVVNPPSFFSQSEVEAMSITLDGWEVVNDGSKFTMTLNSGYTWGSNDTLEFTIEGVESDGGLTNGETQTGYVLLSLDRNIAHTLTTRVSSDLGLVWENFAGTLDWKVALDSDDGFTMVGPTSGSTTGNAQTTTTPISLTTATDSDGNTWNFGYIFTYTTDNNQSVPEVCAAIWKEGSAPTSRNMYTGYYIVDADGTSTAYYKNQTNATSMAVTVTLGS